MTIDYRGLARAALERSLEVRTASGLDLSSPVNVFDTCEQLGITVRFVDISLEGMYVQGKRPQIILSSLRPLARRVFNCAHELGHFAFDHGTTADELLEEWRRGRSYKPPKEFTVDVFAGFFLMPVLGVRKAFAVRHWQISGPGAIQVYTIACSFGVGYETLVAHLTYSLDALPSSRADMLLRETPKSIRQECLGFDSPDPLIVVDEFSPTMPIDAEVGTRLLLPRDVKVEGGCLVRESAVMRGTVFRCVSPGIARAVAEQRQWAAFVRVARFQFVGLSRYRHLENEDE